MESILQGQALLESDHGLPKFGQLSLREDFPIMTTEHGRWKNGWVKLVEDYTRRKLTYGMDKLPALSGLARLIEQRTGDKYFAGLWKCHIIEDLAWTVYGRSLITAASAFGQGGDVLTDLRGSVQVPPPSTYRAPSWSWASLDAPVIFIQMDFDHIVAEYIDCYVEPAGNDPYGIIKSGWIKMRVSKGVYNLLGVSR